MKKKIRIITEKFDNLGEIAGRFFDGFSVSQQTGYWRGLKENSAVIEITDIDDAADFDARILSLCAEIKSVNRQECVLVETFHTAAILF